MGGGRGLKISLDFKILKPFLKQPTAIFFIYKMLTLFMFRMFDSPHGVASHLASHTDTTNIGNNTNKHKTKET